MAQERFSLTTAPFGRRVEKRGVTSSLSAIVPSEGAVAGLRVFLCRSEAKDLHSPVGHSARFSFGAALLPALE